MSKGGSNRVVSFQTRAASMVMDLGLASYLDLLLCAAQVKYTIGSSPH